MRDIDPTASEYITSGYLERSRPNGVFYDIGSVLGIGSALIGSDSAGDAATHKPQQRQRQTRRTAIFLTSR